jgi:hypothetical protein
MDSNECETVIPAARGAAGCTTEELLSRIGEAGKNFGESVKKRFSGEGEW